MPSPQSTIQSLKTVDQWIDIINGNINGGVRTGFKSSRLKFTGSNVDVGRSGSGGSPLQFAETGLAAGNTVIDFTQGAVTASTESTHLAIQGNGWFTVVDPASVNTTTGAVTIGANSKVLLTRDGEFRTNAQGLLVNANGYYVVAADVRTTPGQFATGNFRTVYNNVDTTANAPAAMTNALRLSDYLSNTLTAGTVMANGVATLGGANYSALVQVTQGQQSLKYSQFGSTVFDFGFLSTGATDANIRVAAGLSSDATILNKSLEASNASMTQSVPELSLAQKLFSALTKVLQTTQTNQDAILGLIR
jgi:flagellar hook protein FlgE